MDNALLFGRNNTQKIVSIEVTDESAELFIQQEDGSVKSEFIENRFWILSNKPQKKNWSRLKGSLHYCYGKQYDSRESWQRTRNWLKNEDIFTISDPKESLQVLRGLTYYKGLTPSEISILSFDLETTSLDPRIPEAKILLISNTFRKNGKIIKKLFAYDEFEDEGALIDAWCDFVRECDPSIICGHNINSFDIPYLKTRAEEFGTSLKLGRNGSDLRTNNYESKFRKDGSQDLHYKKHFIYGREICDTLFVAYKHDIARNYPSYGLKQIIEYEGLREVNRTLYDASKIRQNYTNPEEWTKIKKYCEDDSDEALKLFDLMIPASFYSAQMVPKSFQGLLESASGSQINSMMIRSYLQEGHSLPKASEVHHFEGAISLGLPGIHRNVLSFDVASLYPSIMLQYNVNDLEKDPKNNFIQMLQTLTTERLKNKKLAKETGNKYYKDLEQSQKIYVNSMYGFKGATGLLFNDPSGAELVTKKGREILQSAIEWATSKKFEDWKKENNLE